MCVQEHGACVCVHRWVCHWPKAAFYRLTCQFHCWMFLGERICFDYVLIPCALLCDGSATMCSSVKKQYTQCVCCSPPQSDLFKVSRPKYNASTINYLLVCFFDTPTKNLYQIITSSSTHTFRLVRKCFCCNKLQQLAKVTVSHMCTGPTRRPRSRPSVLPHQIHRNERCAATAGISSCSICKRQIHWSVHTTENTNRL